MSDSGNSPLAAREQAAQYLGFAASQHIDLPGGGHVEIPNPGLLDDEQQERYDALQFEIEQCEHEDDYEIPERTITGKDGTTTVIPAQTVKGELKQPLRKDKKLLTPGYNIRLAQAVLGDEEYAKFKAAGGRASDLQVIWTKMKKEWDERQAADPKS